MQEALGLSHIVCTVRHNQHVMTGFVFIMLLTSCLSDTQDNQVEIRDYCVLTGNSTFHPTCPPGHVIIMRHARYGRMKLGPCMTADRDVGCFADVMTQLHELCSGRRECSLNIPDASLTRRYPCNKDDNMYLEAGYECLQVLNVDECQARKAIQISQYPGYLSTLIKLPTYQPPNQPANRPTIQPPFCNIKLTTTQGRTISLKLHEFVHTTTPANDCVEYAKYTDDLGKTRSPVRICAERVGERDIMTSEGPVVTLTVPILRSEEDLRPFLIRYDAVGCADPPVPKDAQMNRTGNSAKISCDFTQKTWNIICQNNAWVGLGHNCSEHVDGPQRKHPDEGDTPWTLGLLLAIVIGVLIGVMLGMLCLCTVTCVYRRGCSGRTQYEHAHHPRAQHEHVHMLPPDHAYECARTLPHQTIPNYDQNNTNCPYHSLRHNKDVTSVTSPRLGYGEKPSIVQDCETCVDQGHTDLGDTCHHGHVQYPDQTLHVKRFLHEDIIPYNLNDRNFAGS